jgi:hypothetical protein
MEGSLARINTSHRRRGEEGGQLAQKLGGEQGEKVGRERLFPSFIFIPNIPVKGENFLLVLVSSYQFKHC